MRAGSITNFQKASSGPVVSGSMRNRRPGAAGASAPRGMTSTISVGRRTTLAGTSILRAGLLLSFTYAPTAVDRQHDARDGAGRVAAQEHGGIGTVFGAQRACGEGLLAAE